MSDGVILTGAAVVLAVCWGLGYAVGRGCRRFVPRTDAETARKRVRVVLWVVVPVAYVFSLFAVTGIGWLDFVEQAAASLPAGFGATTALLLGFGTPLLACTGPYLGLFPAIRDARGLEMTTGAVTRVVLRYLIGFVVLVVGFLSLTLYAWIGFASALGLFVAVGIGIAVIYAVSPLMVVVLTATRQPTGEEANRLANAMDRAEFSPRWVRVQQTRGSEIATAYVRGPPGARAVFVTDHLLDASDDEALAVTLTLLAGRAATYHMEIRSALGIGTVMAVSSLWVLSSSPFPGIAVTAIALLVGMTGLWLGRRLVYRVDALAARRFDHEQIARIIEELVAISDAPRSVAPWTQLWRMEPSVESRLTRLRQEATERPAEEQ